MGNIAIALQALIGLTTQATQLSQLLQTAQSENRDLTPEELSQVQATYAAAHTQLDADIAARGG